MSDQSYLSQPSTDSRRPTPAAIYSFAAAVGVCILVVTIWWELRPGVPDVAVQRKVTDVTVTWRCPRGHTFQGPGAYRAATCPVCGRPAEIAVTYVCPEHGDQPALIRLTQDAHGREQLSEVSFTPRIWINVTDFVACPVCGQAMTVKQEYSFSSARPSEADSDQ